MRKIFSKILCFTAATVAALGVVGVSACSAYNTKPLGGENIFTEDDAVSNGGFAVEKGGYVYFINGREANTADNTFGNVVKGAVMRISKSDLAARNYSEVDTVVPQIAYSGNNNAGIFVYGDYVYYSTPSTELNSDGVVQNSHIAFKSAKLDGTEAMRGYYAQYSDNTVDYRFVEDNGKVYLIYVATNENLYGTSCTNIHSVNTETGENTLLAYNVDSVTFDKNDLTNPRIYYTMNVTDFVLGSTSQNYNQIWTVTPDGATANEYSFEGVKDYDPVKDPLYVNCGTLVFDGIGRGETVTPFNSDEEEVASVDRSSFKYTLSSYENDTLFYTRTSVQNDSVMLFAAKESDILAESWKPFAGNPDYAKSLLGSNGAAANNYVKLFDVNGDLDSVIIADATGLIKANVVADGNGNDKIVTVNDSSDRYYMTRDGQATILFADKTNNYIYYSLTGGNGYTVNRVSYSGGYNDYNGMPILDEVNEFTSVRVLDLDASSDWYKPELIENQLLFPTETLNMTDYDYIMVCDLRGGDGLMNNKAVSELTEKYNEISEKIGEVDSAVYAKLPDALRYAFYSGDGEYVKTLVNAYGSIENYSTEVYGERYVLSDAALKLLDEFVKAENDWEDYAATVKVNGNDVAANKRDYYYALLGKMNDSDAEAYSEGLKSSYLSGYPEEQKTWFEGLSTGAKVGFIIGVCAGGLLVIAAAVIVALVVVKKRKQKLPVYKKRIKVDTTDDKNIDVYSDDERAPDSAESGSSDSEQ